MTRTRRALLDRIMRGAMMAPIRRLIRQVLVHRAEHVLADLRRAELAEFTGPVQFLATIAPISHRHAWSLGAGEQFVLQAIIAARHIKHVFEIGTFNGGTTRMIAEALPPDGTVVTIDLAPDNFDATQKPKAFTGEDVGRVYKEARTTYKVTQLLGNSLTFDFSPYAHKFDLVLVDGGHQFEHGVADTRSALQLLARGGLILWDDFEPHWHGLVRGITVAMDGLPLQKLAGTALGIYDSAPVGGETAGSSSA